MFELIIVFSHFKYMSAVYLVLSFVFSLTKSEKNILLGKIFKKRKENQSNIN